MNRLIIVLVSLIGSTLVSCAAFPPELKVTVFVVSDDGTPIPDAEVMVFFRPLAQKGKGERGRTDEMGVFTANGRSDLEFKVIVTKQEYYESVMDRLGVDAPNTPGQFVPEDKEVTIVLRKIQNPQSMYAKKVTLVFPENGKTFGFDMKVGDWVAPHGKGVHVDLFFSTSGFFNTFNDRDTSFVLSFPNKGDGVQPFETPWNASEFISPYEAPLEGYLPEFAGRKVRYRNDEGDIEQTDTVSRAPMLLLRVRTELDPTGKVISAQYGKIYNGFTLGGGANNSQYRITFTYYLNPNVNDRNLEYDVSGNLTPNLGTWERVYAP